MTVWGRNSLSRHCLYCKLEGTKIAMWNEMGNSNTSPKAEGDVSAKATEKSSSDDAPEEAETILRSSDEAETTDGAREEESARDAVGREDMKGESLQTFAEKPAYPPREAEELAFDSKGEPVVPPREAEELALDSNRETGLINGCVRTERDGLEKVDTSNLPEVMEELNQQEHEDGWQQKRTTPSICMNLEDAALTTVTNDKIAASETVPEKAGTGKSTKTLSSDPDMVTSVVCKEEFLGPAEPKAGGLTTFNELGSADGKDSAITSTLHSSANKDGTLAETDGPVEESKSNTVQYIWEDDANLGEKTDNTSSEMKSIEMGEPGDSVQNGGEVSESKRNSQRNSFSSLDLDNAILHHDRSMQVQIDDTRVEDEGIVLVKPTDLIGIPSYNEIREVGGQFEYKADQSPSEDDLAPDLENTDARRTTDGDLESLVDEEGAFEAVKPTEYDMVEEGFPTLREECFVGPTRYISTLAESEGVVVGTTEAEKPTKDTNSGIKIDTRVSYEDFQAFDPLKLNQPELTPSPINEEASKVESEGGNRLLQGEDKEALDFRTHGSKTDKAVNLRMKKSPSFDFDLRITRTEESDRTPLLFQDKRVVRTATATTADYDNGEKKKLPIDKERILSFGHADSRIPSDGFSKEEHDAGEFQNRDNLEKQEKVLLLGPAKEPEVVEGPSSDEQKGKRRPRSSLFGNCMCCATVMN